MFNIILKRLEFPEGPSRGRFFGFFEPILDLLLMALRSVSSQQCEHAKPAVYQHSEHFGLNFLDLEDAQKHYDLQFFCSWRSCRLHMYSEIVKST